MAESTGISWCDATMNPWVGCTQVSPGCANCYALTLVTGRMGRPGTWGEDGVRERTSESLWKKPIRWNRLAADGLLPDGTYNEDGHRPRVFCASLADVFEPRPELDPWRADLFALIEATPNLDWLVLTKRPEVARDWLMAYYVEHGARGTRSTNAGQLDFGTGEIVVPDVVEWETFGRDWVSRDGLGWGCLPNLWVGTSIENSRHTWRADVLREIPAAVRFISAEPLLGSLFPPPPVTLSNVRAQVLGGRDDGLELDVRSADISIAGRPPGGVSSASDVARGGDGVQHRASGSSGSSPDLSTEGSRPLDQSDPAGRTDGEDAPEGGTLTRGRAALDLTGIDWVITGGESGGRDARPMSPVWAREIRDAVLSVSIADEPVDISRLRPALHFKQFGSHDENGVYRGSSPKSSGKLLDGVEWCEFPTGAGALSPA